MRCAPLLLPMLLLASAGQVFAQAEAPIGVRAAGMGGAFVGIADDASAVVWIPAGLASGSYFSVVLDDNVLRTPDESQFPHRRSGLFVAVGTPPLGLSYYRTRVVRFTELAAFGGASDVRADTLVTHNAGVTLVQTVGASVSVGATLKYVRGTASSGGATAGDVATSAKAAEAAQVCCSATTSKFDADIGVMAAGAFGRAGLSIRNALQPEFSEGASAPPIRLDRRIRGGVSLLVLQTATIDFDLDFTKATTTRGRWRDAALGAEIHAARKAWVRGGVHWNTAGDSGGPGAAPIMSLGASYTVYGSFLADGQVSFGSQNGDRGFGAGLRVVF